MPNHIVNIMHIVADTPERVQEVINAVTGKSEDGEFIAFDFDKLVPMPANVEDWYHWRIFHWGTKWNTYYGEIDDNVLTFSTAWSTPRIGILTASKQFPDVTFEVTFADEDVGYNCGEYSVKNGELVEEYYPKGGSDEAMEIYLQCHEWDRPYYFKGDDGEWHYNDDLDEVPLF